MESGEVHSSATRLQSSQAGGRAAVSGSNTALRPNLFSGYDWVNYWPSNDLPFEHIASACFEGDEPAVLD
jgi:hypothetical protein